MQGLVLTWLSLIEGWAAFSVAWASFDLTWRGEPLLKPNAIMGLQCIRDF
jgi:hypothetical protein